MSACYYSFRTQQFTSKISTLLFVVIDDSLIKSFGFHDYVIGEMLQGKSTR